MKFKFNFITAIFATCIALAFVFFIAGFAFALFANWIGAIISTVIFCGLIFVIAGMGDLM